MIYTTTSDPSDGYSNHWSNAPEIELEGWQCPECESEETFETPKLATKYCCTKCWCKF